MPKFLLGIALLLINASAIAAPGVTIHPSGDMTGATDQANIQAALVAAGTDDQAKIKLARGTFYINSVAVTGLLPTSGAYSLFVSTNVQIWDESLPAKSKKNCHVLH